MPHITQLVVYPIKGCGGVSVSSAVLESTGLLLDRTFCLVRADGSGKFVACRHKPNLLLVQVKLLDKDGKEVTTLTELPRELVCSAEGQAPLRLSLAPATTPGQQLPITVWEWTGLGDDCGDEAGGTHHDLWHVCCCRTLSFSLCPPLRSLVLHRCRHPRAAAAFQRKRAPSCGPCLRRVERGACDSLL
jgi:hypothetical protein